MSEQDQVSIAFDYIKSPQWRTVHVDGLIGGITPNGSLHLALYSERPAIPQRVVHPLAPNGTLGPEIVNLTETRGSIVRELDVDAVMSIATARAIRDWFVQTLEAYEASQMTSEEPKR